MAVGHAHSGLFCMMSLLSGDPRCTWKFQSGSSSSRVGVDARGDAYPRGDARSHPS